MWVTAATPQVGRRDQIDRVGGPRVLGQALVVVVRLPGVWIERDVLQDGAEVVGCGVDLRLRLSRDANRLGVAAALEVEDALVTPSVLVIADQPPGRVRGERCLAGAGESEEQSHVAI